MNECARKLEVDNLRWTSVVLSLDVDQHLPQPTICNLQCKAADMHGHSHVERRNQSVSGAGLILEVCTDTKPRHSQTHPHCQLRPHADGGCVVWNSPCHADTCVYVALGTLQAQNAPQASSTDVSCNLYYVPSTRWTLCLGVIMPHISTHSTSARLVLLVSCRC